MSLNSGIGGQIAKVEASLELGSAGRLQTLADQIALDVDGGDDRDRTGGEDPRLDRPGDQQIAAAQFRSGD